MEPNCELGKEKGWGTIKAVRVTMIVMKNEWYFLSITDIISFNNYTWGVTKHPRSQWLEAFTSSQGCR